jgi:hypothetical protein
METSSGPGEAVASVDATVAALGEMLELLGSLALETPAVDDAADGAVGDAVRVDRIAVLERLRGALAAAQQAEMVAFGRSQVEAQITQIADGTLDPAKVGRGIGDQIGLACRVSPVTGSRRLETARVLHADLPGIRALLAGGAISEDTAGLVVTEPAISIPCCAGGLISNCAPPASRSSRRTGRGCWPANSPTTPTRPATWTAAAPHDRIGGSPCARRRTR